MGSYLRNYYLAHSRWQRASSGIEKVCQCKQSVITQDSKSLLQLKSRGLNTEISSAYHLGKWILMIGQVCCTTFQKVTETLQNVRGRKCRITKAARTIVCILKN